MKFLNGPWCLSCPTRGSALIFHPLEHLHPLEYHRPDETLFHLPGSTVDLKSCSMGLELAEAQNSLRAAEEATALSIWAVACICGTLRLEHVGSVSAYDFMKSMFFYHILLISCMPDGNTYCLWRFKSLY